jgi:hypothetical protein
MVYPLCNLRDINQLKAQKNTNTKKQHLAYASCDVSVKVNWHPPIGDNALQDGHIPSRPKNAP